MKICGVVVGALLLALASGCGDSDGRGSSAAMVGDSLVFVVNWQGPADLDLEVVTPSGEAINYYNTAADGCAFVSAEGGRPGPLVESVACTSLQPGVYQARVRNLETEAVTALLEISSEGQSLLDASFAVPAEGLSDFHTVTVPARR